MNLYFDFYGITVRCNIQDDVLGEAHQSLSFFSYFQVSEPADSPRIDLTICLTPSFSPNNLPFFAFSFRGAHVYGLKTRFVSYPKNHWVKITKTSTNYKEQYQVELSGNDPYLLSELVFLIIQSLAGWELEKLGWIRLHAASMARDNQCHVWLAPSGAGKSTRSYLALQSGAKLFSDEITMISPDGLLHPWPLPIQLSSHNAMRLSLNISQCTTFKKRLYGEKILVPIPHSEIAKPCDQLQFECTSGPLSLIADIVSGKGLPQILEFNLRIDTFSEILKIAFNRLRFSVKILLHAKYSTLKKWSEVTTES